MRAQLIQYVDLLFAGVKDCEDIHQEILQNTLDRYDDLIMEGKTPEAAYRLAILSIGDINEILGTQADAPVSSIASKKAAPKQKKWIPIVIAVVAVVMLLNIVAEVLDDRVWRGHSSTPVATHIPQRVEEPEATVYLGSPFYVEETINVRSKPSSMAEVLGAVEGGITIHVTRDEMINGQHWGYIMEPLQGWIFLDAFAEETAPTVAPDVTVPPTVEPAVTEPATANNGPIARGYGCIAADVKDISIEWAAGSIQIIPVDGDRINVEETGDFEKYPMTIRNKNGKLSIEYCDKKGMLGLKSTKDLTIEIPKDFFLQELDIDAASAAVLVEGLNARSVEFEGASGVCEFKNCTIDSLDVDTASGDIRYSGQLNALECDAASASFVGVLSNVPNRMEMESVSGDLDLTLPENAGYAVTMEGLNSRLSSDFETVLKGNAHVSGDGACKIQMEAMSGGVIIRKG